VWRVALRSNEPGARGKKKGAIDLLIDDQSGLFQVVKDIPLLQVVKDIPLPQLRANLVALARAATLAKIPVEEARLKVGASRALLACAYDDHQKCNNLQGSINMTQFAPRVATLTRWARCPSSAWSDADPPGREVSGWKRAPPHRTP
jgi:hypothetical protein